MVKLRCKVCKIVFSRRQRANKYCSRQCYYKMKRLRGDRVNWTKEMREKMSLEKMGDKNPMFGKPNRLKGKKRPEISGEKHYNWKRGYWKTPLGYIELNKNGEKKLEHRKVVEDFLGRKLTSDEIIHHKNEIKTDNRIENLLICTRAEHIEIHRENLHKSRGIIS